MDGFLLHRNRVELNTFWHILQRYPPSVNLSRIYSSHDCLFRLKFHICPFTVKSRLGRRWEIPPYRQKNKASLKGNPPFHTMSYLCNSSKCQDLLLYLLTQSQFPAPPARKPALYCKRGSRESHLGSSSIGASRFPRYQKIQNIRLRKIMRGPEKTKKSQKPRGAKMPTKKRMRPAASRKAAMKKNSRQRPR